MYLNTFHIFVCINISLLFTDEQNSFIWIHTLSIYLPAKGHMGCLQVFPANDKAVLNLCAQEFSLT